jgi:pyruvate dehydrogenase E1 component beta subunit
MRMSDKTETKTFREAISAALWEEMERDERIFIMGEEVGVWGGTYAVTRGFYDHFGEKRVRDTPIAEQAIVGAAVGAAMNGLRPIAEIMTINFAFLALDAIVNAAAKAHYMFGGQFTVPLVIRTTTGGGRQLGATHSHSPEPIFAHFPGLYVVAPSTPHDAKGMLKAAIRNDNPVMFIEHSTLYQTRGEVPVDDYVVPLGKSDVKREGNDVTLVSYAKMVQISLQAADMLAKEGISAEVVDLRSLRPLDTGPVLESFKKTNRCVVVEENWALYGVGAEIAARIQEQAFDWMDAPVRRVSQEDVPLPYSRELEQSALPNPDKVVAAVKEIL